MGQLYSFPSTSLPTGSTAIPVTAIVGYTQSLSVILSQAILGNSSTTVEIDLQVSYDGGSTYLPGGSTTHTGHTTSMGGIYTYTQTPTHFQGTIIVGNGPILLSGSITVS